MKIERFLDGTIMCCLLILSYIIASKMLFTASGNYFLSALLLIIFMMLIVLAYRQNIKVSKKTGKLLFDLSLRKKFKGYKNSTPVLLALRLFLIIILVIASVMILTSEKLDDIPIFSIIYVVLLLNFNLYTMNSGIFENGITCSGKFYNWNETSGIIQYSGNSLEIRLKGNTTPIILYYDITQRNEISTFLKNKYNENLFIDKKA